MLTRQLNSNLLHTFVFIPVFIFVGSSEFFWATNRDICRFLKKHESVRLDNFSLARIYSFKSAQLPSAQSIYKFIRSQIKRSVESVPTVSLLRDHQKGIDLKQHAILY